MKTHHKAFSAAVALIATLSLAASVSGPHVTATIHAHTGPAALYPNASTTPGALNHAVTQDNIDGTICVAGWTKTIRPPATFTNKIKASQLPPLANPRSFEEDHFVSLVLGGSPTSADNLWSEPYEYRMPDGSNVGAREKDQVENFLHREVCNHAMTLKQAQDAIRADWYAIYAAGSGEGLIPVDNDDEDL